MTKMSEKAQDVFNDWLRFHDSVKDEDTTWADYDEWIDGIDGDVQIGSLSWPASQVLKDMDEIAYRCGFSDYVDSEGLEEISIAGTLYYSDKSEDDLLEEFQSDECAECDGCGCYCLPDELTANDPEDGFSEQFCPDCVEQWEGDK